MNNQKYTVDNNLHLELVELIEDTVGYFCDENMISGELAYLLVESIATAKLEQFKGNIK